MKSSTRWVIALMAFLFLAAAAFYGWHLHQRRTPVAVAPTASPPKPASRPVVEVEPAVPAEIGRPRTIRHPIEHAEPAPTPVTAVAIPPLPTLEQSDSFVANALVDLLGKKEVQAFLSLDQFIRHVVAVVDNLPRKQVAVRIWPVQPTPGRFTVDARDEGPVWSAANAARYNAFVGWVDGVDSRKLVALYVRLYPLFQQAYQDLGYPTGYFNDQLIATLDHLLETPEPAQPPRLVLPEVKGPYQPTRPWVMYEFEDPDLNERSAGQKILLRMGTTHTQRLKLKLTALRKLIVARSTPRP